MNTTRRDFLLAGASAAVLSGLPMSVYADPWAEAADIVARIKPPVFPKRDFDITKYGARADGADCTEAIARAITAPRAALAVERFSEDRGLVADALAETVRLWCVALEIDAQLAGGAKYYGGADHKKKSG